MKRYRIGRADTNDVVLTDPTVSREHAELVELGAGRFQVRDLGSTYGLSIREGAEWRKVTEAELGAEAPLRIGDYETTVADLVRDLDRTVVRPHAAPPADPRETAPPAPARTVPPKPAPPRPAPPRPAAPRPAPPRAAPAPTEPPRPAAPPQAAAPADGTTAPPRPAAPSAPAFQFLQNLPPEKRPLVWLGAGFAAFLLIALITLILALAL